MKPPSAGRARSDSPYSLKRVVSQDEGVDGRVDRLDPGEALAGEFDRGEALCARPIRSVT